MRHFPLIAIAGLSLSLLTACGDVPAPAQDEAASPSVPATAEASPSIAAPTCGGVATYVVRTDEGECQSLDGWDACALDPDASSASRLCVYRFPSGQLSATNLSDLSAIAARAYGRAAQALEVCSDNRPTCSSRPPAPLPDAAVACDPSASQACCEGIGGSWSVEPTAVPRCMRLYELGAGCPACGFGFVENRVLTVVLNPFNADKSEYYTQVRTDDGGETLRLTRPEGEQVFSVLVGAHVQDGTVSVR